MTYKWVKIQPTNGPELQYLTQKAFAKNGRIPFCLGGTRAENNLLAEAYSRFKYVHLLYSADKLIGLIYGNSFNQGEVECVEISLIGFAGLDAEAILNEYSQTLPAGIRVFFNIQ